MRLLVNEAHREQRLQKCRCDLQTPVKESQMKDHMMFFYHRWAVCLWQEEFLGSDPELLLSSMYHKAVILLTNKPRQDHFNGAKSSQGKWIIHLFIFLGGLGGASYIDASF